MKKSTPYLFLIILFCAAGLRLYHLSESWTDSHHGYNGAVYSNFAINHLKLGLFITKGGNVLNDGTYQPRQLTYYINHGPLVSLLLAIVYNLFGVHEQFGEATIVIFSILNIILLYAIVKSQYSQTVALITMLLYSFLPMTAIYDHHIDPQGAVTMFFCLAGLYYYLRCAATPSTSFFLLMLASLFLGTLTDWPAYYMMILIALWNANRKKLHLKYSIIIFLFMLLFASFYYVIATGFWNHPNLVQDLNVAFIHRSGNISYMQDTPMKINFITWLSELKNHWKLFNLLLLPVSIAGMFLPKKKKGLLVLFLSFGLLHIVLFRNGSYLHDFWSYYLSPFITVSSALTLTTILYKGKIFKWATLIFMGLFFITSLQIINSHNPLHDSSFKTKGEFIKETFNPCTIIITNAPTNPQLVFYSQREIIGLVRDKNSFEEIIYQYPQYTNVAYAYQPSYPAQPDLLQYLNQFTSKNISGFTIYTLRESTCPQ